MKQYVIIGNGVAAIGCIEGIRKIDTYSKIVVVSEEKYAVYCRPLISYYLGKKTDLRRMNYRGEDFYESMGCDVLYGKRAVRIDHTAGKVVLDDGSAIPYTAVCVAAGSAPFIPPFEGLEKAEKKFTFMTLDDALALEAAVNENSNVLIIGAGLIGLKCAEGLHDRAAGITVCDLAGHVLSSILDTDCAVLMQKHLEANGIQFILGDTVCRFEKNSAVMKSGKTVNFDVLVLAVGVRANISLVKDIGGEVNRGIIVNDRLETSIAGVYAAGDCTEGEDISCARKKVLALLPNACMQGHAAGVNMAGGEEVFDKAIPMNSIGLFGLHVMSAGSCYREELGGECHEEKTDGKLKRLFTRDGYLTGFILIGETERAGIYTSLIREKTPLDTIDFNLLKKIATSAAFSPEIRRKKFGGVV
jgi:NAD(P)H-nitrite reductase large subunit